VLCVTLRQEQRDDLQTLAATTRDSVTNNKTAWQQAENKSAVAWVTCVVNKQDYMVANENVPLVQPVLVENKSQVNTQRVEKKQEIVTLVVLSVVLECTAIWVMLHSQELTASLMNKKKRLLPRFSRA
jgi:hypothetical protein